MDEKQLQLYSAFGNFATENLFWSIFYLNSMAFGTPLRHELRTKLLNFYKMYESIICSVYDTETSKELVAEMARNNSLFVSYVDTFMRNSYKSSTVYSQWEESGSKIAHLLCSMNAHWQAAEWSAMIAHQQDLLDAMVHDYKQQNYTSLLKTVPVCRRLAIEMAQYMSSGIVKQWDDCSSKT